MASLWLGDKEENYNQDKRTNFNFKKNLSKKHSLTQKYKNEKIEKR